MTTAKPNLLTGSKHSTKRFNWKTVLGLVVVGGFLYLILPHLGELHSSIALLKRVRVAWLLLAFLASLITYAAAAGIYLILAKHRLRYAPTLLVQSAGMFVNRLLPGGVGSLGVNFEYLRKNRHSVNEAGSVIATNNLCGLAGHLLVLFVIFMVVPFKLVPVSIPHPGAYLYWMIGCLIGLFVAVLIWSRKLRNELYKTVLGVTKNIGRYRTQPLRLAGAVVVSMSLTLLYALCLTCCGHAITIHLAFGQFFLIMTAGVLIGTITPTPGGLLGAEAGLLAGLVAYGVPSAPALAVVLLYRLLTYWLALIMGLLALLTSERIGYL